MPRSASNCTPPPDRPARSPTKKETLMQRRILVHALAAAALAAALCAPAAAQPAREKVVLMLNWYVYSEHAPFFLGKERGFYDAENIDLEIQEGRGSAVTVQAVAAGSATFAYADVPTMIRAPTKGAPLQEGGGPLQGG